MRSRLEAIAASLLAVALTVVATAGVAALTVLAPPPPTDGWMSRAASGTLVPERGEVLAGDSEPTPERTPQPATAARVRGIASNYPGTAGWIGQATVALPGDLGGRYTGEVNGEVTVCADRCATFPVVDWCQCHWGTDAERIVDLSHAAWAAISDAPLSEGLVEVTVTLAP